MKFPKNRANVYVVQRGEAICGVFLHYDDAEDYAGACKQEWYDKTGQKLEFKVSLATYYG